jgi:predicted Zn-dependent peptidase
MTSNSGSDSGSQGVQNSAPTHAGDDILGTIERLAKLRDAGALTEEEFSAKKSELLSRL